MLHSVSKSRPWIAALAALSLAANSVAVPLQLLMDHHHRDGEDCSVMIAADAESAHHHHDYPDLPVPHPPYSASAAEEEIDICRK